MKATSATKIVISTSASVYALIKEHADESKMDLPEAAEDLIRLGLLSKKKQDGLYAKVKAESKIMKAVDEEALKEDKASFPEDITRIIFGVLQKKMLSEYENATGGDAFAQGNPEKARINRRIGRRIKALLDAKVVTEPNGEPKKVFLPSTEKALITAYTALTPGGEQPTN